MNAPPTSAAPRTIARHTAPDPLGFDALRAIAIERAQAASGELWTDYNLHDPGVSLLEALCFALTEDVFAARQPVPALLGLGEHEELTAWERLGLHDREALLPCRPVSEADWRLWLLRALPGSRQLAMNALRDWRGRPLGLWRLTLQASTEQPDADRLLRERALRAFRAARALGEDLAEAPRLLRPRWVRLEIQLSITGEREPGDLLAEVLRRCDAGVSRQLQTPVDGQDDPEAPAPLADDPDLPAGPMGRPATRAERYWLAEDDDFLYASDLARLLQEVPGVASVDGLRLRGLDPGDDRLEDAAAPPGSVARRGRDWALRLRWPATPDDLRGWAVRRDGLRVQLPEEALLAQLALQRRVDHARDMAARHSGAGATGGPGEAGPWGTLGSSECLPRPPGPPPPLPARRDDHLAATAALPPLYHEALRLRDAAQPGLHAQWTGYAALLELGLNQVQQQREQLPRLFALDDSDPRSYWHEWPGGAQLPGVEALYLCDRRQAQDDPALDAERLDRRHRFLDFQLALHGEALDVSVLDGLPCYFTPQAWPLHLLALKRQFMRRVIRLGRDRGAGPDYSQPLLGNAGNTPPLQERLGLLLGLAKTESRPLTRVLARLARAGLELGRDGPRSRRREGTIRRAGAATAVDTKAARTGLAGLARLPRTESAQALLDPRVARLPAGDVDWTRLAERLIAWTQRHGLARFPLRVLRAAVDPSRFRHDAPARSLRLATDDTERDWVIADGVEAAEALDVARELHAAACLLQADGEGLHVVEHLLLRPLAQPLPEGSDLPAVTDADQRVSIVLSGWTARGAAARFRMLAAQAVEREAPIHLHCELLWLDAPDMLAFEPLWREWLQQRQRHELALLEGDPEPASLAALDRASEALSRWLDGWPLRQRHRHAARRPSTRAGAPAAGDRP